MQINLSPTILVVQTAFIGDTILASHFANELKRIYPEGQIHFLLRKGNETVIRGLAAVEKTWVWDKKGGKTRNLLRLIRELRSVGFDMVFNLHRHFNSGLVTALVGAPLRVGFKQNPLSFFYTHRIDHKIPHRTQEGRVWHEVQRNLQLLQTVLPDYEIGKDAKSYRPALPLAPAHFTKVAEFTKGEYFVLAPASVWFTKAWAEHKYRELTSELVKKGTVLFIGGPGDRELCDRIRDNHSGTVNLCGQLSLLESAALMRDAKRVFVNDSAPLHLASCVDARTTAIFCSTVTDFGYTPLAQDSVVVDVGGALSCRPCGLHGHKACPLGHFKCAEDIEVRAVLATVR